MSWRTTLSVLGARAASVLRYIFDRLLSRRSILCTGQAVASGSGPVAQHNEADLLLSSALILKTKYLLCHSVSVSGVCEHSRTHSLCTVRVRRGRATSSGHSDHLDNMALAHVIDTQEHTVLQWLARHHSIARYQHLQRHHTRRAHAKSAAPRSAHRAPHTLPLPPLPTWQRESAQMGR